MEIVNKGDRLKNKILWKIECFTVVFGFFIAILAVCKYEQNIQSYFGFKGKERTDFSLDTESYRFDLEEKNLFEGEFEHEEMGDYNISFMGYVETFQCVKIGMGG